MSDPRYVPASVLAQLAREHLLRDIIGFLAYRLFMALPTWLVPFRWTFPILPYVGDWSERDARWALAFEAAIAEHSPDESQQP